jgi:hypothetical protein
MTNDRRNELRVPESRLITQLVNERPHVASVVNLSGTGVFSVKPSPSPIGLSNTVQLEIPLPEASESIWAAGEVVYERVGQSCIGAGILFTAMANRDRRFIRDVVEMRRQQILSEMMREIRRRKELAAFPSPFDAGRPSPRLTEDTVRMYLLSEATRR